MEQSQYNIDTSDTFFSVMSCVEQVCLDLDLPSAQFAPRLLSWALNALVDLKLDAGNDVKVAHLPISEVCTVQVPGDCVDVVAVCVQAGQYLKMLNVNNALDPSPRTKATWNPSRRISPGTLPNGVNTEDYNFFSFPSHGGNALIAFSGGLPQTGHYKIASNNGCKEILLDSGLPTDTIVLIYVSLGINFCGETILHPYFYNFCRTAIHYNWARFGKRADKSEAEIQRLGRDLWHEEMQVRGRTNTLTPKDILMIGRRNYRLTNKI